MLNNIYKINDTYVQKYLLYKIIENDGILIDNYIYSKKYGKKIICGHWKFLMDEDYTDDDNLKEKIRLNLLDNYSDRVIQKNLCKFVRFVVII